ncbi:MAG: hypothetical protein U1E15_08120 [Hyphomicrobiales bacterium]
MPGTISTEQALIYVMVMMSGVEGTIKPQELAEIELLVATLPVLKGFDRRGSPRWRRNAATCCRRRTWHADR